jgi:hypothetical protein
LSMALTSNVTALPFAAGETRYPGLTPWHIRWPALSPADPARRDHSRQPLVFHDEILRHECINESIAPPLTSVGTSTIFDSPRNVGSSAK